MIQAELARHYAALLPQAILEVRCILLMVAVVLMPTEFTKVKSVSLLHATTSILRLREFVPGNRMQGYIDA